MGKNENDIKLFKNYYHCVFFVPGKKQESQFEDDFVSFRSSRVEISRDSFFRLKLGFGKRCSNVSKIALFELEFRAF